MHSLTLDDKNAKDSKIFHFEVPYAQMDIIKAFEGFMSTFKIKNETSSDDFGGDNRRRYTRWCKRVKTTR